MTATSKLTLEDFLALPETEPGSEFVDGEVVQKPMPTGAHITIQRLLSFVFTLFLKAHPIGEAGPEWRCVFGPAAGNRVPLPDFAFVRRERLSPTWQDEPFHGPPDLAVEVVSPDDRWSRVWDKVQFYLDHGVRLVWVIDPKARTVLVLTPPSTLRILSEAETLDGGDVVPGFSVAVRDILPPADLPTE